MNNIASNIRNLRREKGLSQEQLAELLHVTRQTVSTWERSVAQPSLDTLGEIAKALEVEPERLLYGGQSGRQKPAYRAVSFWPVMGVLLLYFIMVFWILPIPMFTLLGNGGHGDTVFILCGQIFLSILVMFCYCALKDFIQNREFYDQSEEQEEEK